MPFAGAHNLDRIRLEGDVRFARAPALLAGRARQAIAEEHALRASSRRRFRTRGWNSDACISPFHVGSGPLPPAYVATLYRALRKAREDTKDEPGAADFYYGEMEMRRMASPAASAERFLLTLYWLVSGYGLRASRALAALVVLVLAGGLLLDAHGVPSAWTLGDSLLFSVKSTISLLRPPEARLTDVGEWIGVALRILGPLLFALVLLSLRGRVKR